MHVPQDKASASNICTLQRAMHVCSIIARSSNQCSLARSIHACPINSSSINQLTLVQSKNIHFSDYCSYNQFTCIQESLAYPLNSHSSSQCMPPPQSLSVHSINAGFFNQRTIIRSIHVHPPFHAHWIVPRLTIHFTGFYCIHAPLISQR